MSPDSRYVLVAGMRSNAVAVLAAGPEGLSQAEGADGCIARRRRPRDARLGASSGARWTSR